jgi:hypothetical protein
VGLTSRLLPNECVSSFTTTASAVLLVTRRMDAQRKSMDALGLHTICVNEKAAITGGLTFWFQYAREDSNL